MTRGPGTLYYAYVDFFEYLIPVTCSALDRIMVVANMVNVISFMVSHSIMHNTRNICKLYLFSSAACKSYSTPLIAGDGSQL